MELRFGTPEEAGMSPRGVRQVVANLRSWTGRRDSEAIVAVVARRGVVIINEACGVMESAPDAPAARIDTAFPLCSLSKPITATAAMILVEEGKLGLHLPVSYYIPEFQGDGKQAVTVFHLMTHTTGLRAEDVEEYAAKAARDVTPPPVDVTEHPAVAAYLAARYAAPLWKPPGTEMTYADINFTLLGEILRRVSGRALPDFAGERIFAPLGMKDTHYAHPDFCIPVERLERPESDGKPKVGRTECTGGWVVYSTAMDLAVFGQMFLNGGRYGDARILSAPAVAAMTGNQIPGIGARYSDEVFSEACWGLGWSVVGDKRCEASGEALLSPQTFCHGGAGGVHLWVDPTNQLVAAYLSIELARVPGRALGNCGGPFISSVMAAIEKAPSEGGSTRVHRSPRDIGGRGMVLRPGTPEEAGMSSAKLERVRTALGEWMVRREQQTTVVCVARRGLIVIHEAFGHVAPDPGSPPVPLDALFPLASVTKLITATAAMVLVEQGKLGLHLPVSFYVPEFGGEGKEAVTAFHLLTHTSGLREEDVEEFAKGAGGSVVPATPVATQHPALAAHLARRYATPLWKRPGTEMSYCGFNFDLLGEIVRRASGMSLPDFAQARIFDPLGMRDTYFALAGPWAARLVGYPKEHPFAPLLEQKELRELPLPSAMGFSTARDLAVFAQMFLNGGRYGEARVLSPLAAAAMVKNQIPGIGARFGDEVFPEASWGLGWDVKGGKKSNGGGEPLLSSDAYCHGGAGGSLLWVDPLYEVVGVYLPVQRPGEPPFDVFSYHGAGRFVNTVMAAIEEA